MKRGDGQAVVRPLVVNDRPSGLRVRQAVRWWERAIGLLATPALEDPAGLWIEPCSAVHMVGMRYPIDAVFLARDGRVLKVYDGLRPMRASACLGARTTLELRAGLARQLGLQRGDRLALR